MLCFMIVTFPGYLNSHFCLYFDVSYFNQADIIETLNSTSKKGKRKVQGVPQSQTAALPRPQEEEETDKSKQAQIEQMYEKH